MINVNVFSMNSSEAFGIDPKTFYFYKAPVSDGVINTRKVQRYISMIDADEALALPTIATYSCKSAKAAPFVYDASGMSIEEWEGYKVEVC